MTKPSPCQRVATTTETSVTQKVIGLLSLEVATIVAALTGNYVVAIAAAIGLWNYIAETTRTPDSFNIP